MSLFLGSERRRTVVLALDDEGSANVAWRLPPGFYVEDVVVVMNHEGAVGTTARLSVDGRYGCHAATSLARFNTLEYEFWTPSGGIDLRVLGGDTGQLRLPVGLLTTFHTRFVNLFLEQESQTGVIVCSLHGRAPRRFFEGRD